MSKPMTLDDLRRLLVECAGEVDGVALSGEILDTDFDAIGYDSLALMETAARVQSEFGVIIPDEVAGGVRTPRELLDMVNTSMVEV
jgi:act minimal PKS acyl carrier protein